MVDLLEEFCKDVDRNGELIRCCSCFNTLAMAGKYEIQPIEGKIIPFLPKEKVQGLVCENCIQIGRKAVKAVVILGDKGSDSQRVTYINIDDLAKPGTTTGAETTKTAAEIAAEAAKKTEADTTTTKPTTK